MKKQLPVVSIIASVVAMGIAVLVIIGWIIHNDALRSFVPGTLTMKFNLAIGFIFSVIALTLFHNYFENRIANRLAVVLSLLVFAIGFLTLIEYCFGVNIGIDELFVRDGSGSTSGYFAGRMSLISAVNFCLMGIGLLLIRNEKAATYHFYYLIGIAFISFLMLISLNFISDIPVFIHIPLHAAVGFIALSIAMYFAQPILQRKISFERRFFTGFAAVIILIVLLSIFSSYYSDKRISTSQMVNHTNTVLLETEQALSQVKDVESGGRGYVITGDSRYLEHFTSAKNAVVGHVKKLKMFTIDNPAQQQRVDSLFFYLDKRIAFTLQCITLRNEKGFQAANDLMATLQGRYYTDKIRYITSEIQKEENNLLEQRRKENEKSIRLFNRVFVIFISSVFILLTIILFTIRQNIRIRKNVEAALAIQNTALEQKVKERTEEIERSEKRYHYLFENNPMPMWVIDLKTYRFLDVNEMAILQYGYSGKEFLSMTALDIRPDDEKELFTRSDHSPKINAANYNRGIWKHRKKDGRIIEVEIIAHDIIFEGMPARFILANDVTEKRRSEEKLIASEKQFRNTLDTMLEGAQIIGFDWRYLYVNESLAKHGKYSREELLGHTVMEKYPGIEDTEIFKVYQRCFDERVSIHLENEFTFPDKSKGWFELSFQPVPEGIFILSIDITERKKAEAAILHAEANYREIFEKASDAIYVHEIGTGKVLEVNHRATEITGFSKEEIINGDPRIFITGVPGYTIEDAFGYLQKAANGEPQLFEWLGKNKDGSYNWLEVNLKKANIAGQERILAFFREINDRKKIQLEIQRLNEELEQKVVQRTTQLETVNKELEAFSYSISHDLRAPLRGIVGFTTLLEDKYGGQLDDEAKRITSIIKNNTLRMGNLIDDLLNFSRLGRQDIVKSDIHTNELVREIIVDINDNANKITWDIQPLPVSYGDINAMRQVWTNLVSNAKKYSRKVAEPHVEIGSYNEQGQIVFFVRDNGVGFDNKYKDKLFKVFQRLHTISEFEGTGVGLAIVEKIISKHGGKVWAEAEKNKGATFYFSLPYK